MAPKNGSNGGSSDFQDALDDVMRDSEEAMRLADEARAAPDDPKTILKAEKALAKAAEAVPEQRRREAAEKALAIDPGCTDALVLIASGYHEPMDASLLLEGAVEVAERRLGSEIFEQGRGGFWLIPETRPYIRAMHALAEADFDAMDFEASFTGYGRILELAEGDNLGLRYTLLGMLLAADRVEDARKLAFEKYGEDETGFMLWARTLILYLERKFDDAGAMLEQASAANPFVQDLLVGSVEMPEEEPEMYTLGSPEEAAVIVSDLAAGWRLRPLALVWLQTGGGKPGDDRYFGGYTDVDLDEILNDLDDEGFDDEDFDDEDFDESGPILLN